MEELRNWDVEESASERNDNDATKLPELVIEDALATTSSLSPALRERLQLEINGYNKCTRRVPVHILSRVSQLSGLYYKIGKYFLFAFVMRFVS
jgi:hypothetical protein